MTTGTLQPLTATTALDKNATAAEIRAQVNLIQEVMQAVMKDGTHFGTIPGTPKPTLYKAGSEKILSTFRIGVDPIVEDLSTHDEARFRVRARGFHQGTGAELGFGVGECSSNEEKYCWRGVVCDAEWDEAPVDRRRKKWKRGDNEPYQVAQVRTVPADVANTVLKMAKKRAQIDLTLTVTGASDVFTQDIEDLPEELRDAGEGEAKPKRTMQAPQRKKDDAPAAGERVVGKVLETFKAKSGSTNGKDWIKWGIKLDDQKVYNTFEESEKLTAEEAKRTGEQLSIEFKSSKYGRDIVKGKIAIVEKSTAAAPVADNTPVPEQNPEPGSQG